MVANQGFEQRSRLRCQVRVSVLAEDRGAGTSEGRGQQSGVAHVKARAVTPLPGPLRPSGSRSRRLARRSSLTEPVEQSGVVASDSVCVGECSRKASLSSQVLLGGPYDKLLLAQPLRLRDSLDLSVELVVEAKRHGHWVMVPLVLPLWYHSAARQLWWAAGVAWSCVSSDPVFRTASRRNSSRPPGAGPERGGVVVSAVVGGASVRPVPRPALRAACGDGTRTPNHGASSAQRAGRRGPRSRTPRVPP